MEERDFLKPMEIKTKNIPLKAVGQTSKAQKVRKCAITDFGCQDEGLPPFLLYGSSVISASRIDREVATMFVSYKATREEKL
jgi:hypothetical protein